MVLESVSAFWWTLPGLYVISKSYACSFNAHLCNLELFSWFCISHFKLLWSVTTVNLLPSRQCENLYTASTRARHSFSVVEYFSLFGLRSLSAQAITFSGRSPTCWESTAGKENPLASVYNVNGCSKLGYPRSGRSINLHLCEWFVTFLIPNKWCSLL